MKKIWILVCLFVGTTNAAIHHSFYKAKETASQCTTFEGLTKYNDQGSLYESNALSRCKILFCENNCMSCPENKANILSYSCQKFCSGIPFGKRTKARLRACGIDPDRPSANVLPEDEITWKQIEKEWRTLSQVVFKAEKKDPIIKHFLGSGDLTKEQVIHWRSSLKILNKSLSVMDKIYRRLGATPKNGKDAIIARQSFLIALEEATSAQEKIGILRKQIDEASVSFNRNGGSERRNGLTLTEIADLYRRYPLS